MEERVITGHRTAEGSNDHTVATGVPLKTINQAFLYKFKQTLKKKKKVQHKKKLAVQEGGGQTLHSKQENVNSHCK